MRSEVTSTSKSSLSSIMDLAGVYFLLEVGAAGAEKQSAGWQRENAGGFDTVEGTTPV